MDNLPGDVWTLEEYRAHEEGSEVRHEFYAGQIFAMAGASPRHTFIKENLSLAFGGVRPAGAPVPTFGSASLGPDSIPTRTICSSAARASSRRTIPTPF